MAQTARVGTPSKVQNLVLYWPPYKAQLMLHSAIEANTCGGALHYVPNSGVP